MTRFVPRRSFPSALGVAVPLLLLTVAGRADPTFDSTSTGSDGALDFSSLGSGTTLEFDPTQLTIPGTSSQLNPAGDNVYNFTTIKIPSGVTIRMHANHNRNAPIYWLASGAVDIEGTLDLSGDSGHPPTVDSTWGPSQPGPGGYPGGVGTTTSSLIASGTAGLGPGGVPAGASGWDCVSYNTGQPSGEYAEGAHAYGNLFLLPLIGGSGGNGAVGGGGAGGGAILIASSASITVNGTLRASGGGIYYPSAGVGSGGAIHLLAPTIAGNGRIAVDGESNFFETCLYGYIRVEAFLNSFTGNLTGVYREVTLSPSAILGLPTGAAAPIPTVNIVSVGGVSVPASPTASFVNPDVSVNSSTPLVIDVNATNVPLNATVSVYIYNETLGAQSATVSLSGTAASSSGSATVSLPPGFSHIYANATWN